MISLRNVRPERVLAAPSSAFGRGHHRVRPCLLSLSARTRTQGSSSVIAASSIAPSTVKIQGRKMDVTPAMKEFISEKISKSLSNYAEILREVRADFVVVVVRDETRRSLRSLTHSLRSLRSLGGCHVFCGGESREQVVCGASQACAEGRGDGVYASSRGCSCGGYGGGFVCGCGFGV